MTSRDLDIAVDRLYAAAAGEVGWSAALTTVSDLVGAAGTVLNNASLRTPGNELVAFGRMDPAVMAEYARDWLGRDARARLMAGLPEGTVASEVDYLAEADLDRDPYWGFMSRVGLRYCLSGIARRDEHAMVAISPQFTPRHGPPGAESRAALASLLPHVRRAVGLHERFGGRAHVGFDALDGLAIGVVVISVDQCVLFANRAAEAIAARQDGLWIGPSGLHAAKPAVTAALAALIDHAARRTGPRGGTIRLPRAEGVRPYGASVYPLPSRFVAEMRSAAALVFVTDPDRHVPLPGEALRALWELTAAEARLAEAVANGVSLKVAAERHGVTYNTVRTQVQRILDKTGAEDQTQLAVLMMKHFASIRGAE